MIVVQKKNMRRHFSETDRSLKGAACLLLVCLLGAAVILNGCAGGKGAEVQSTAQTEVLSADDEQADSKSDGKEISESEEEQESMRPDDIENGTADIPDCTKAADGTDTPDASGIVYDADISEDTGTVKEQLKVTQGPADAWIVTFGTLNVRRFCYPRATVVGQFAEGQKITVTGPARYGFYPVTGTDTETGEEISGYCSADYLTFMEYTGKAVRLDVVKYKQTDDQWGDIRLGESRYTIAQIGCTTTCFAMCESYLTGTEITPDAMMENLIYSREGNLYWPEDYCQDYGSDYLMKIYQKLHQGIPVLIGSRRSNGSQHWVLVTGYDPKDKEIAKASQLKASDFIINDPGAGRSNLGEFFRDLPYFIKIAYYTGTVE